MNNMKTIKIFALLLLIAAAGNSAIAQMAITLPPRRAYTFTGTAASGSGTLTYQWYRNGVAISGANSQNYTLPAANAEGVGVEFKRGTVSSSCPGQTTYSNIYNVTFCGILVGQVCWASENASFNKTFASRPDEYTPFFQWNRATAWASTGPISGWNSTADESSTWTINPCPTGWQLPTLTELSALHNSGTTWVNAGTRGAAVNGRFYGANHTDPVNCTLPSPMINCIFLPASSYRSPSSGSVGNSGTYGYYWTSTQSNSTNGCLLLFNSSMSHTGSAYQSVLFDKAYGMNIRCVQ